MPAIQRDPTAIIFFATGVEARRMGWRRRWRMLRKRPGLVKHHALAVIARTLAGMPFGRFTIGHCAIGFEGAVLDPTIQGNRFYPEIGYALNHPTLIGGFTVPLERPIDLDRYPAGGRKPIWPSLRRFLTDGASPVANDCIGIVCDCLRAGGIPVPRRIYTPIMLCQWLMERGYPYVSFAS